jgi:acyl carrier protein
MTSTHEKLRALWLARILKREDRLVAFVVPRAGLECDPDALRLWLARALPQWMIPTQFTVLNELPRTPSGKVNRGALPAPVIAAMSTREVVPPRTPLEERLAELFAQTLGVRPESVDDDFFTHLGGHSLIATQLAFLIRREWPIDFPLRVIFESPTIAGLAAYITVARQQSPVQTTIPRRGARTQ